MATKFRARLAHITGYAWRVIDDGKFLAGETVKDCGFADIGPSDNRYFRRALFRLFGLRQLYIIYIVIIYICLLYTSPSPRDGLLSRMPSSA